MLPLTWLPLVVALGQAPGAPPPTLPENLVFDLRLFEARLVSPDLAAMHGLSFFIATDGTEVRANQWLSTLASRVSEGYLGALRFETLPLVNGEARAHWTNGARSFDVQVRPEGFSDTALFRAQVRVEFKRGDTLSREFTRPVDLAIKKTSVWSSRDLAIHGSDYLSHFREVSSGDRGPVFEGLRRYTLFLILTLTPRLAEPATLTPPEILTLPPGTVLPDVDSPFDAALHGTIVLGLDIDPSGAPLNPQILLSTIPEANMRILGEVVKWSFPRPAGQAEGKRRGRLEVKVKTAPP